MSRQRPLRPHGQIRQSQVLTTFGPGAMVDLPNHAVLIGGLEQWTTEGLKPIFEERLTTKLQKLLEVPDIKLFAPPIDLQDPFGPKTGITAWLFPEWFVAQYEEPWGEDKQFRSRPLLNREALVKNQFQGRDRKKYSVIPIRFVQACVNGHISDIDWYEFGHKGRTSCRRLLWIDERGTSGDLADVFIRCECNVPARSLAEAAQIPEIPLGYCKGLRPWLGAASQEQCGGPNGVREINRLLVRSASNAYFPQVLSVISIPDRDSLLRKAIDPVWEDYLLYVDSMDDLQRERKKAKVFAVLQDFSDDQIMAEIKRRKSGSEEEKKSIKQAEIEMLQASQAEIGDDQPDGDFFARRFVLKEPRIGNLSKIGRVVLVHRLREVVAQIGFTRFESASPDIDGELSLGVRRASLAYEVSWLPAIENRGEGIFLAFDEDALNNWVSRSPVKQRGQQLLEGFNEWKKHHSSALDVFPGLKYILLHSLSHLLICAISMECGYSASSIRERIYASSLGHGILLYTGTPDSEGTLGGLVQAGRKIEAHLQNAIDLGRLCSNDPVCAQHRPNSVQEERFLHGAACHGCLLIAEPSCERRNEFLDRALLVPTVEDAEAAFFIED
jgi:hypothetical protein